MEFWLNLMSRHDGSLLNSSAYQFKSLDEFVTPLTVNHVNPRFLGPISHPKKTAELSKRDLGTYYFAPWKRVWIKQAISWVVSCRGQQFFQRLWWHLFTVTWMVDFTKLLFIYYACHLGPTTRSWPYIYSEGFQYPGCMFAGAHPRSLELGCLILGSKSALLLFLWRA